MLCNTAQYSGCSAVPKHKRNRTCESLAHLDSEVLSIDMGKQGSETGPAAGDAAVFIQQASHDVFSLNVCVFVFVCLCELPTIMC